ncbi:ABC transporter ATP-binding protein [Halorarius litoreus]|uniref:ABC transporter ATP-binding protein n=1 Tax=Halorarius litoreus TaxID=2962676 RepID=UPI0020CC11A0|nr:ABC transporter ATP-binding protein [Halorarius litoreus]
MGVNTEPAREVDTDQLVRIDGVESYYGQAQALFGVSFGVDRGSVTAIIGPNGAGKTTLLDCLTGFKEYSGTITYADESIAGCPPWELGGDRIGYCTEKSNLFEDMTVLQNLRLGSYDCQDDIDANLERVFELFPRLEERTRQRARTLSGGEQKMLAIGRSLMADPELLLLDEPSLGLAPTIVKDIKAALEDIIDTGVTVLVAEQDVSLAMDLADRIMLLENGSIEARGTPAEFEADDRISETYFE